MANARAMPSNVEVPRPTSTISTRLLGGVVQDRCRFGHLDHERGAAGGQVVGGTDAREDLVERTKYDAAGWHETADMRHQRDQGRLAHVGGFTAHIRAGDEQQATAVAEPCVVGDERFAAGEFFFDDRMPPSFNEQTGFV